MKQIKYFLISLLLIVFVAIIAWKIAESQNNMLNSDFFTFWLGSKLVLAGQNPYDPSIWLLGHQLAGSTWLENAIYCYPLPLAYILIFIGVMPIQLASPVWVFLSICSILGAIILLQSRSKDGLQLKHLFPIILGLALFRPIFTTIRNGQIGGFILLVIVLVLFYTEKKKWIVVGLLSTLLYLKPTIGLPILGLLFIWLIKNNGLKAIITNVITSSIILGISILQQPDWVYSFLKIGLSKGSDVFMITPTIWGISGLSCGLNPRCTVFVGSTIFTFITISAVILFWKYSKKWSIWLSGSIFVLVSLLITPYLWVYDQVLLLLPIIYFTSTLSQINNRYLVISLIPLLFTLISQVLLYLAVINQHDVFSILLTIFTGGAILLVEYWKRKTTNGSSYI